MAQTIFPEAVFGGAFLGGHFDFIRNIAASHKDHSTIAGNRTERSRE
jgi:hypothetical protein